MLLSARPMAAQSRKSPAVAALPFQAAAVAAGAVAMAAAFICGRGAERVKGWGALFPLFLAGHAIILAVGWAGLASFMDPGPAFTSGIVPFLPGAVLKSLAAAATVALVKR